MASDATMSNQHIDFLSQLLLSPDRSQSFPAAELQDCLYLAHKNHVVVRWLQILPQTPVGTRSQNRELGPDCLGRRTGTHRACTVVSGCDLHGVLQPGLRHHGDQVARSLA